MIKIKSSNGRKLFYMKRVYDFLKNAEVYYLATTEGTSPAYVPLAPLTSSRESSISKPEG